jgi:hypothetical protein
MDTPISSDDVPALYTVDLSSTFGAEYKHLAHDMLRMLCIQATIQIMIYFSGDSATTLLTREFLLLLIYVEMGVLLYWLVIRKLWRFQ